MSIVHTQVVFQGRTECTDDGGYCTSYPTQTFNDTFMEGTTEINFTITQKDFDTYNLIEFYVISSPDNSYFDQLIIDDAIMVGKDYSSIYSAELKPRFK